jgi:ribonuclease J
LDQKVSRVTITASGAELSILPLGGCGEIGLNATLFTIGNDSILLDCGALLSVDRSSGIEKAVPGFEPIYAPGRRLLGVVLTHGHEDHLGGLPALLAELDVPVFGSPLTLALARARLEDREQPVAAEARAQAKGRLMEVPLGGRAQVGPFSIELVRVTHSVPDSAAVLIETAAGRVLHSGDFKLDDHPLDGKRTDVDRLKALGDQGIDLLLSDSTNSERPGRTISETKVKEGLRAVIGETEGRAIVTVVGSHLHRLLAITDAAIAHGRKICLVGRAVEENWRLGVALGHLPADPGLLVLPERMHAHPRDRILVIASGAQGEPLGGLARVAAGEDAALRCLPGDRVIFSARTIPGHERAVRKIINELARQQIAVVQDNLHPVHCSGHAQADEQAELIRWVRPKHFVPVHGEPAMLAAHAKTAIANGVKDPLIVEDGQSLVLGHGGLARGPKEVVSRRAIDAGGRVLDWGDVRERSKIGRQGLVVCSIALDRKDALVGAPAVTFRGIRDRRGLAQRLGSIARSIVESRPLSGLEAQLEKAIRSELKSSLGAPAPEVMLQVLRIDP